MHTTNHACPIFASTTAVLHTASLQHGPFAAFLDAPGEKRTWTQRFELYVLWWIVIAATAAVAWEAPWFYLEESLLRLDEAKYDTDHFHEPLRHLWIFWAYGIADGRFLTGDPNVLAVEACSTHTHLLLIPLAWVMRQPSSRRVVWAYWAAALGLFGVAYGTVVYVLSESYGEKPLCFVRLFRMCRWCGYGLCSCVRVCVFVTDSSTSQLVFRPARHACTTSSSRCCSHKRRTSFTVAWRRCFVATWQRIMQSL